MSRPILITGATGKVGRALTETLNSDGIPTRLLVRSSEKAEGLSSPTSEIVQGDMSDVDSLHSALEGIETLFLLTPPSPNQIAMQRNVLTVAKATGLRHVVKLSAIGTAADSPVSICRWHAEIEHEIRDSNLGFTFLRPHSFMQNMLGSIPTIQSHGAIYGATGDAKFSVIDARDVAAVAAVILKDPSAHRDKTYHFTGPEALSQGEMAAKLGAAIGKDVKYVDLPSESYRQALLDAGLPPWLADLLKELAAVYASGRTAEVSPVFTQLVGREGTSFSEFASDYATAFK
jgi:uncharacterized protein YbjT (DUF2867 family)